MSVIVKGMKMPKDCYYCDMSSFGTCNIVSRNWDITKRPDWCPLVELPEKHGRLVDADTLSDEYVLLTGEVQGFRIETLGVGESRATLRFKRWKDVPTVVEAEGGKE